MKKKIYLAEKVATAVLTAVLFATSPVHKTNVQNLAQLFACLCGAWMAVLLIGTVIEGQWEKYDKKR